VSENGSNNAAVPLLRVATGIEGLDRVLGGGLPSDEICLLQGGAGTGKTTVALQFLLEGARAGERVLYITLSQTEEGLRRIARSHGWSLEGVDIHAISAADFAAQAAGEQTLFHTADVELGETMSAIRDAVTSLEPARVVFDSVAELRLLAGDPLRYQRQLLGLRQFFADRRCSMLLIEDSPAGSGNKDFQGLLGGLLVLEQSAPEYGNVRRRFRVLKMRGMSYHGGYHNFRIRTGGVEVYPRFTPNGDTGHDDWRTVESGVAELDALLGGGLEEGTACLVMGPTGTGKTALATLYAYAAAQRGERAAVFLFDERVATFYRRSEGLGMDLRPLVDRDLITVWEIDVGEISPGEFTQDVRRAVDENGAKVVLIDTLSGYFHAMPQEHQLVTQMHELMGYLSRRGVLSLLVVEQSGIIGADIGAPVDVSYMADTVLLLRHFEAFGNLRKAVSVVKKRYGPHETTIRELRFVPGSVQVGEPLEAFHGVLAGSPTFHGERRTLMDGGDSGNDEQS